MFLYAFSIEDRDKLIASGYKFIHEGLISNKKTYVFANDNKLKFSKDVNVLKMNRLYF